MCKAGAVGAEAEHDGLHCAYAWRSRPMFTFAVGVDDLYEHDVQTISLPSRIGKHVASVEH